MIHNLRRAAPAPGLDLAALRATTIAMAPQFSPDADPATARATCEANLNAAALAELHQHRAPARKHTVCHGRGYIRCDCWPGDCIVMGVIMKRYSVSVAGWGDAEYFAPSPSKARMKAYGGIQTASGGAVTFKRFLQICAGIRRVPTPPGVGRDILVGGRPAKFIEDTGHYIRFHWPDSDVILCSHPLDVTLPEPLAQEKGLK
jgi:hypothetical protein